MEINGGNPCSNEKLPSEGSKNVNEESNSIEKEVSDSVFINHAEIAWHQRRKEWVGDQSQKPKRVHKEPVMSWTTTYEDLLLSTDRFHQPIPLAEMVDFLVDIWHEEGLYD
ncbi:hypothetical protein PVL29_010699 [Vitis rotundifolia]|uniref:Gag1-like clamp domain-containing protein n=1 Tax=Vitis rotundifolia TaxID=103349 RepID=A0AA38ZUA2_VITRO|nr:hypothetical protein PVL29_010699 [Vitis rotundifolia]